MTRYFDELFKKGVEQTQKKKVVIFGMVRDCGEALKNNIPTVETIGSYFSDYRIVVLENNSKDGTKQILLQWQNVNPKVQISINDFDESKYDKIEEDKSYFKYFQLCKLQKYYDYRNMLLNNVEKLGFESDFSILIDMDVIKIDVKGVVTSFGNEIEWDAITANGYSYAPSFKRRFHDTFALCEFGLDKKKQTLKMVRDYRYIFSFLRKGQPFFRVFSSYGGIAIYKTEAIKGLRYAPIFNNFGGVQVRCEHFALFKAMAERGYDRVYINPNMEVFYQKVTLALIIKKIRETMSFFMSARWR